MSDIIKQRFSGLQQAIKQTNIQALFRSIKLINQISTQQIKANKTLVTQRVGDVIPNLTQQMIYQQNNINIKPVVMQLKKFKDKYSNYIRPTWKNQLNTTINNLNKVNQNVNKNDNKIAKQQLNQQKTKRNPNVIIQQQIHVNRNPVHKIPTIQQHIQPIKSAIIVIPPPVNNDSLPKSLNILDQYCKKQGFMGTGTISQAPGRGYIGRYKVNQGGRQLVYPYPKNKVNSGDTPDIVTNFQYYANRTINSWNQFVQKQHQLIQYTTKIATQQGRKKFVADQIAALNWATFFAQCLATLTYYYIQVPLQHFFKYKFDKYDGTMDSFLNHYETGNSVAKNPLLLSKQQGTDIAIKLFTTGDPGLVLQSLDLQNLNVYNKKRLQQLLQYPNKKIRQATAYYNNMGINPSQYQQALRNPYIKNIKQRRTIIPQQHNNSQILSIINQVNNNNNIYNKQQQKQWSLNWNSNTMKSHDYIWNYNIQ